MSGFFLGGVMPIQRMSACPWFDLQIFQLKLADYVALKDKIIIYCFHSVYLLISVKFRFKVTLYYQGHTIGK